MRNSILSMVFMAAVPASALADTTTPSKSPAALEVKSSAFGNNGDIPPEFTCDGASTTPPLSWSKVPAGTKSVALLVEDPDAPNKPFTHWLVTGIPPATTSLGKSASLPQGAVASKNGKGHHGYTGPCPPSGLHHYAFRVYALDITLPTEMTRDDFVRAINGHTLASGELMGTYRKKTAE
jgi:Raf kinase inhibitor-like YbhB/YbcL family protein